MVCCFDGVVLPGDADRETLTPERADLRVRLEGLDEVSGFWWLAVESSSSSSHFDFLT
jgi:hypothetical protein